MSGRAASELMRSVGLMVDGPAVWGSRIASRGPGVFVVELPAPVDAAPIDEAAVSRWLQRVPSLTLDGERPAPRELGRRLAEFWLADESILFVGRSTKALGARLAAIHATPLGDARPSAAGHWLKTLTDQNRLRVWWAETEAHEEYEDELLAQFAAGVPAEVASALPDASAVLPFANLVTTGNVPKRHGIRNSLREPLADDRQPAGPARTAAKAVARRPAGPRQPRSSSPRASRAAAAPPPGAPTYVSTSGRDDLAAELDHLRNSVRPVVIARVKAARELGDLRENADYEAARNEQSFVEGRIQALESLLRTAVVVDAAADGEVVGVGSSVVVEVDGEVSEWVIVGSSEANPSAGRISYASPVGRALVGRRAGDEVTAQLPRGELRMVLREVR